MKVASWIVTGVCTLFFILRVFQILNTHDYLKYPSAAIAGTFTFFAIIPIIMWIITFLINRNQKNKSNYLAALQS